MEEEISIIGCSGCTHELFDHTAVRQTQTDYEGIVQETCVTVTWMKFCMQLLTLTGDPVSGSSTIPPLTSASEGV